MYRRRSGYSRYRMARRMMYGGPGIFVSLAVMIATLVAVAWYTLPLVIGLVVGTLALLYSIKWGCWLFLWLKFKMFPRWHMNRKAYWELYKLTSMRLFVRG